MPVIEAARSRRSKCQLCFPNPEIVLDFESFAAQVAAEGRKPPRLGRGDADRLSDAGMTIDEYANWDAEGFTVMQALDLSASGMSLDQASAVVRSGTRPIDVWRENRPTP
jgi:hypothetical protein